MAQGTLLQVPLLPSQLGNQTLGSVVVPTSVSAGVRIAGSRWTESGKSDLGKW